MNVTKKKNLKFTSLYNTFTETERNEFRKFLKNNYNGRNYDQILDAIKINEQGNLKINSFKSSITIWNRFSELQHLAENFIIQKSFESKSPASRYLLMTEYRKRELFSPFQNTYKTVKKEFVNKQQSDNDTVVMNAIEKLYLENLKPISTAKQFAPKMEEYNKSKLETLVVEMLEFIITAWIHRGLKQININVFAKEIFEAVDFSKLLLILSKNSNLKDGLQPSIRFLHHLFLSIDDITDNVNFYKAKKIFLNDLKTIPSEKREYYFSFLIYFGIEKYNIGIREISKDLFFLMNKRLKEGFKRDMINKDLAFNNIRNYIYIALSMKKYKWINDFVKNYGKFLHPDVRNHFVKFCKAILSFESKDFKACKEELAKINKNNPFSYVDVSILKLKVLFELNIIDECHDELRNFKEYLRKERDALDHLIVYAKEFTNAYTLLLKINQNPSQKNINELQFLLSKKLMIGKKWIAEKLKILIPNRV
ncbi:MAG: hypothetical protein KDD00_15415 [Ignavibacteriae bacterium]|nr:hypothetical protein [Ignavibacteriota bacterium]